MTTIEDIERLTQSVLVPPPSHPRVATGYAGGDAEDLGERILALKPDQVRWLREYLKPVLEGQ